jgi:signal transduction histidine kinase
MKLRSILAGCGCLFFSLKGYSKIDTNAVNTWNQQALDLAYSEPKKGFDMALKALEASRKLHFSRGEVRALIRMGIIYDVQSENRKAIDMYEQSLALSKKNNDFKGLASNLNNLGLIYWKLGELDNALNYLTRAYTLFRQLKDELNLATTSNNIGLIYEEEVRSEKALKWHRNAVQHYLKAKETYLVYDVYSNMGNAFETLSNEDSSRYYSLKAIEGYRKTGNRYGLAISLSNYGNTFKKKEPARSVPYFKESMELSKELGSPASYLSGGYNLGAAYHLLHDYDKEKAVLEEVYPLIEQLHAHELGHKICLSLAQCYYREGDIANGDKMLGKYTKYHGLYYREIMHTNVSDAEKKFEVREARQRNKLLQQQTRFKLKQQSAGRFMDNLIWTASVAVLLLIGFLIFFVVRKRNLQQELISQKAVFEATTEERKRISYDLHDHVGSQLSYVVNNLELIQHLDTGNERVQRTFAMSQAAMSSLRDTVWALHSEELTLQSLSERMENVARKTLESSESVRLSFESRITHHVVIPQQITMHVMRIFQEAVHNVVKHAKASQLTVKVWETETGLQVTIADNGVGIVENPERPFHYGLQSMKERADKIGGKLTIANAPEGGTVVTLSWPKNNSNA